MKRTLVSLVAGLVLLMATSSTANEREAPCKDYLIRPALGQQEVARRVTSLIGCAAARFDPPDSDEFAVCVARGESSLWPWAGTHGNYVGLFQHVRSAWESRARRWLKPEWAWQLRDHDPDTFPGPFDAWANTIVSVRMARSIGAWYPTWGAASRC